MANVLSLALKVTADASGLKLDPVQRALTRLGDEADKLTSQFDKFASGSAAAAAAQADFAKRAEELANTLRDGGSATQYAAAFEKLQVEARELAVAFEEGARVTERYRTEEEKQAIAVEKLNQLFAKGAIDQETFNRAVADASGANAAAARAAAEAAQQQAEAARVQADALRQRQALEARAAQIINANLTAQERYEQSLRELNDLQRQGLLTQDQYNRAVAAARKPLDDAAAAAERAAEAGRESSLRFNELSGIFAVLPGPLGNIAGRISGISSASEGLSRIFAGGLRSGITNLVGSFTALVNPVTAALAGITALAAGATAVARGLIQLEDRVERLGNLADQLGVSFEFVQVLEETGRRTGVSLEGVAGAMSRLQRTLAGADEESKKATRALQNLGLSVKELDGLTQQQQIELIGKQLAGIEDPAKRSAAAIELFGRSGVSLLPFFRQIGTTADDIQRLGGALSDIDRTNLDNLGGSLDAISRATIRLGELVLLPFTGVVTDITNSLADLFGTVNRVAELLGRVFKPAIDALGASFKILGFLLQQLNKGLDFVFGTAKVAADSSTKATQELRKELEKPLANGLAQDMEKAFTSAENAIRNSIGLVGEFGSKAFFETRRFNAELEALAQQFDTSTAGGVKAYTEAVDRATNAYNTNIEAIRTAQRERERLLQTERTVADTLIEQLRIQREFGGDNQRAQAANNVLIIEREIARAQAFGPGNEAAQERVRQLQEILAVQQRIADGSTQQADADGKRVQALLGQTERVSEVEQNILAIKREQERVQLSIADSVFGASDEAFKAAEQAAAEQEEQLKRLLAQQEELLKAQQLGFADGFDAAFANVGKGIENLVAKASEFGDAGIEAARQFEQGIAAAQQQARDGILNREAYEQEVARQQELFNKQLADIQALANERQRINQFVDQQLELARFNGDSRRLQASQNVAALEAEIARVTAEINAAREAGDQAAVRAGIERLGQLDQVAAKERDIADGKAQEREQQRKFFEEQSKAAQQQQQQQQQAVQAEQQRLQQLAQAREQEFQRRRELEEQEFERQLARVRALNSVGQQTIGGADIRSSEGANQFIRTAAGAFDPAQAEQLRIQKEQLAQQKRELELLKRLTEKLIPEALGYLEQGVASTSAAVVIF